MLKWGKEKEENYQCRFDTVELENLYYQEVIHVQLFVILLQFVLRHFNVFIKFSGCVVQYVDDICESAASYLGGTIKSFV